MHPALQQKLTAPQPEQVIDLFPVLVHRGDIGILILTPPAEIAKFAKGYTNVRDVHIPVDNPADKWLRMKL